MHVVGIALKSFDKFNDVDIRHDKVIVKKHVPFAILPILCGDLGNMYGDLNFSWDITAIDYSFAAFFEIFDQILDRPSFFHFGSVDFGKIIDTELPFEKAIFMPYLRCTAFFWNSL